MIKFFFRYLAPLVAILMVLLFAGIFTPNVGKSLVGLLRPPNVDSMGEWLKPIPLIPPKVNIHTGGHWVPQQTYTPADTLPVIVDISITQEDTNAVVTIDGTLVTIDSLRVDIKPFRLRWSIFEEIVEDGDLATGVAWQPLRIWQIDVGPFVSTDIPEFDWVSVGGRLQARLHTTLNAGLEVGYRINDGVHVGVSTGFCF